MNAFAHDDARDVFLTIVPHELDMEQDVLDTIVDLGDDDAPVALPTPAPVPEEAFSIEPAPKRTRSPLVLAGAVGGGMIFGGGVVATLGMLLLGGLLAFGSLTWWMLQPGAAEAPEVVPMPVPVEAPLADDEGVADDEAAEVETAEPVEAPATDAAPEAPEAPTPAPARAPAPNPNAAPFGSTEGHYAAPAAPAPVELPADLTVKLLSDPPAASIAIDGVPMGRTPLKTQLSAGSHTVTIESGKATGTFTIDAGLTDRFCFGAKGRKVIETGCN